MSTDMQEVVFNLTEKALQSYKKNAELSAYLKKEMDKQYGTTWHCIVGKNFGSFVSHEAGNFIYFYIGDRAFQLFKTS
ncbi:hypothetical protein HPODL_05262 [Ogataea parapolymorpha DL-1]|uniref:Dynein light chain n=1 Tax=Ogataea parapolymorpha (strain ATCC 26012 / BCRC 20466 / JCM 22074 / NRRL Y-7560 / DL-1) TaxID=871575 RepID=W1QDR1_OGAPD|nr:hypothetical protein HPODL_05262 [Ogataea parapolymorpha DL-1]ESW98715.1 hypothetical protein HPODL_05262 [Ogataea parapolymorpha DL-1]